MNENCTHEAPAILPGGLIPLDQWALPEASVRRTLKDALGHMMVQLRVGMSVEDEPFQSLDGLPPLSERQRRRIAPEPDHAALAEALLAAIEQRRQSDLLSRDVVLLVAPPFSGVRPALAQLDQRDAQEEGPGWRRISPPDELLTDAAGAVRYWDTQDLGDGWVIPELAEFWLRHTDGLALIRELLGRVASGATGQGLIGCSSWCWQFWEQYLPNAQFGALSPAPMNAEGLGRWFESIARSKRDEPITARMADDGRWVLPMASPSAEDKRKRSGFLREVANTARGIPGVALAIWQRSLRARPDEHMEESELSESSSGQSTPCWVVPFDQISLPTLPQSRDRSIGFVLHGLLLHDGLADERLARVTGMGLPELRLVLARLARADVIRCDSDTGQWRITALGYPTVRRHLQSWGYPVDAF